MTNGRTAQLAGRAQDLGDGRFGVIVDHDGTSFYIEHAVSATGLHARAWDEDVEDSDEPVAECTMDWDELITHMFVSWKQDADTGQ